MIAESAGKDLLDEMKHIELKQYKFEQVYLLERELASIESKIENLKQIAENLEVTEQLSINFSMLKSYKERINRIIRSYKFNRLLKIQDNYFIKNNIKEYMNQDESTFQMSFNRITDELFTEYKHLLLEDRKPPLNFYVQIMTLEDCGIVLSGNEFVELKKGRIYFMKKSDISHLLKKEMVKII